MPEPTGHPTLDTLLVWAGVGTILLTLGAGLWRALRAAGRLAGRLVDFLDDWNGEPARPGVPARLGVMERVRGIESWMDGVRHELQPNSGASLRDAVDLANCRLAHLSGDDDHCRQRAPAPPDAPPPAASPP